MRRKLFVCVVAIGALLSPMVAQSASADSHDDRFGGNDAAVFADGGVMAGSTNGMSFAPDGTLWIGNVLGATITQIDPDTGEILSRLTAADGVFFPDDVIVGPDSSIYWTDIGLGTVFRRLPDGTTFPLLPVPGGLNSANPLTLNDDGTRMWAAGCYGAPPANNSFVELDPSGADPENGIINVLRDNIPGCASNGMSWSAGFLYSPQPFTNEILRLDPELGSDQVPVPVTTGWSVPIGTAFDSEGNLYALAQGVGEVVRVDLDNTDTANNRTVIATIPVGWADNIAISDDDRIFISSASDAAIAEVMPDGQLREVVPGQFQLPLGAAVIGQRVYTAHLGGLVGYNRRSGEQIGHFRAPFGVTEFPSTTSMVPWGKNLVLMSALTGDIKVWNPRTNAPVVTGLLFPPTDAQPFRGDLIVTQGNGEIVRLSRDLEPIDVVATVEGATGLARKRGNVYVADSDDGTVLQIVKRGRTLRMPRVVVSDLAAPEGIDIHGNYLYVVEGGTQSLTRIDLKSGERETIATNLGFQGPSPLSAGGWFNDVSVARRDIFVNADRANVLYKFERPRRPTPPGGDNGSGGGGETGECGDFSYSFAGTRLINDGRSNSAGPFTIDLPAGTYDITMKSMDAHDARPAQPAQTAEQWRFALDSGYMSPLTDDVPDDSNMVTTTAAAQRIDHSTAITVHHRGEGGVNSVNVVCVGFTPSA